MTESAAESTVPVLTARKGVSPVMVGRAAVLDRLIGIVQAAEVAAGTESSVALVSGEPGIGKSRLVDEFVRDPAGGEAIATDIVVLRAQPGSLSRPYDTFAPILGGSIPPAGAIDQPHDQVLLDKFAARVNNRVPLILVVEDIHWIDAASASVIDALARQPWPSFVLVGTYRSGELRHGAPGGELVLRLERSHAVEQLRLERLGRSDVDTLIAAITGEYPDSAKVEAVYRRSDGVPFVVEEIVRAAQLNRGGDRAGAASSAELPWSLSDAIEQQLAGIGRTERLVVDALAVYNDPASFETLASVTELDDDALIVALRELIDRGVLAELGDDRFWFVHALTAESIAQRLLARERRRLHERCFDALSATVTNADLPIEYATLARHAIGAGRFDDVPEIAREGAARALESGATFLALRLAADGLDEAPGDPTLLAVATEAAWRMGFQVEACDTAARWVAVASGSDLVDALRLQARLWYERNDPERGDDASNTLANVAGDDAQPRKVRASAAAAMAQLHMLEWRGREAVDWADRAIAEASKIGDRLTVARASVDRASALSDFRPAGAGEVELRRAIELVRAEGDLVWIARGINNLLCRVPVHSDEGRELIGELETVARSAGFDKLATKGSGWNIQLARGLGDLPAARRAIAEALSARNMSLDPWTFVEQAILAIEEGRLDDGEALLDGTESFMACHRAGRVSFALFAPRLLLASFRGDREAGRHAYEAILQGPAPPSHWEFVDDLVTSVDAALAIGVDVADVRDRLLGSWVVDFNAVDDLMPLASGLLLRAEGDIGEAVEALSLAWADRRPRAPTRAVLGIALAQSLAVSGDRARALEVIDQIVDRDLARWPGVRRDRADELRLRLRRAEGQHRGGTSADPGPGDDAQVQRAAVLTPREREVAVLLAEGLTNGQLAERLYISPKTAAVHVSNILAKLGLSSRAEIAAWSVRNLG